MNLVCTSGAETTLHNFAGGADGSLPSGIVALGSTIYGITVTGGSTGCGLGCGTIYSHTPAALRREPRSGNRGWRLRNVEIRVTGSRYLYNEEYAREVNTELSGAARRFLAGDAGVIATVREMVRPLIEVERFRPEFADAWRTVIGIDSETDALPIGQIREMWHPSTAAIEDAKVRDAEERYRERLTAACREILKLLYFTDATPPAKTAKHR